MDPFRQLTEALAGLVALPFVLAAGLLRLRRQWRALPLQTKSQVRAGAGAAGLAVCTSFSSWLLTLPHGTMILAVSAALSVLYLIGGALGSRGWPSFDIFSAFWFAAGLACVAFLIFGKIPGFPWLLN